MSLIKINHEVTHTLSDLLEFDFTPIEKKIKRYRYNFEIDRNLVIEFLKFIQSESLIHHSKDTVVKVSIIISKTILAPTAIYVSTENRKALIPHLTQDHCVSYQSPYNKDFSSSAETPLSEKYLESITKKLKLNFSTMDVKSIIQDAAYFDMILGKNIILKKINENGVFDTLHSFSDDGLKINFSRKLIQISSTFNGKDNTPVFQMSKQLDRGYLFKFWGVLFETDELVHVDKIRSLIFSAALINDIHVDNMNDLFNEISVLEMISI